MTEDNNKNSNKKLPVLLVIFRRKDTALKVLESIRNYQPKCLYIAADGPRREKEGEAELCEQTRTAVLNAIDWDCEIKTLFMNQNLGVDEAEPKAITWLFENEEYGIIIEDDCLIHPDFYRLCEQFLPYYKYEERIMLITALNHTPDIMNADKLSFSNGSYTWGWASWRRAWNKMDMNMSQWPQYKFKTLVKNFGFIYACYMLRSLNQEYKATEKGPWDIRWFFSVLVNKGLCLSSNVNLSVNIGITIGGVHYEKGDTDPYTHVPFGSIEWPVQIPDKIEITKEKILAERKEFIRIRKIGLRKILRKYMKKIENKLFNK